jgi:predicted HAD superfamily Cof-like phosphohydrolase
LVRRRGADELEDWIPVTDAAAIAAYRQSSHFEITECRQPHAHSVQRDVADFHEAFNLGAGDYPAIRKAGLRASLIAEEARETVEAITGRKVTIEIDPDEDAEQSLVKSIDGLCDLLAVVYGTAVQFGVNLAPFWDEVHRTNMAKAGGPKRADGKQLKPEGWQPPDIGGLLTALYPGVCRGCGCTETMPCSHMDFGSCGWAEPGLCTACHPDAGPGWEHPDHDLLSEVEDLG